MTGCRWTGLGEHRPGRRTRRTPIAPERPAGGPGGCRSPDRWSPAGYRDMPHHPAFVRHPGERYRTFLTDDLAPVGGQRVSIVGRIDDVIVTGGVKIDPAVVESVLVRVAGVADVVITGVPDAEWGNAVVARGAGRVRTSRRTWRTHPGRRRVRAGSGGGTETSGAGRRSAAARARQTGPGGRSANSPGASSPGGSRRHEPTAPRRTAGAGSPAPSWSRSTAPRSTT